LGSKWVRIVRAKAAVELDAISKAQSADERADLIKKSILAEKLSVANVATITEWISSVVAGANGQFGLSDVMKHLVA
jgi:hypothetical protein